MREILFRGLDKRYNKSAGHATNVWRFGSLIEYDNGQAAIVASADRYGRGMFTNEVIPETVGQYTGLDDKNGVKIFDGDVLVFDGDRFVIFWEEERGGFYLNYWQFDEQYDLSEFWPTSEIIGNIHDNPELIGVRE